LETINIAELIAAGFVSANQLVKVLANGTLSAKLTVEAHAFSQKAIEAIEAVGGTVVKL
jgi:large subunit ribosomal protein L15